MIENCILISEMLTVTKMRILELARYNARHCPRAADKVDGKSGLSELIVLGEDRC